MKYDAQQGLSSQLSKAKPLLSLVRFISKALDGTKEIAMLLFLKKKNTKEAVCKEAFPKYLKMSKFWSRHLTFGCLARTGKH